MNRIPFTLLFLALFLAACDGAPGGVPAPTPTISPYLDQLYADARVKAAEQEKADQEAAAKLAEAQAEKKAQREIDLIMAPVRAKQTETALEIQKAQFEIDKAKQELELKEKQRLDQLAELEAQKAQVETQLEIAKKQRQNQADQVWNDFWMYGGPVIVFLFLLVLAFLLWYEPPKIRAALLRERGLWEEQKRLKDWVQGSIVALEDGSKYHFDRSGELNLLEPGNGPKPLPPGAVAGKWSDGTPLIVREVGGSVNISKPRVADRSTTGRCLELVDAAIQKNGVDGFIIPRFNQLVHYDKTPYYSKEWQELTGLMDVEGLLEIISSNDNQSDKQPGTYLKDPDDGGAYGTLGELRDALWSRRQVIHPLKKAPSPSQSLPLAGD